MPPPVPSWRIASSNAFGIRRGCGTTSSRIVAGHSFRLDGVIDERHARRFLAQHGERLARDLIAHKRADLAAKNVTAAEREAIAQLGELVVAQRTQPHRVSDLAVSGTDLLALGFAEGPMLGKVLTLLLDEVVEDPSHNERDWLLERAARELT